VKLYKKIFLTLLHLEVLNNKHRTRLSEEDHAFFVIVEIFQPFMPADIGKTSTCGKRDAERGKHVYELRDVWVGGGRFGANFWAVLAE
jgi:hypothetical protein